MEREELKEGQARDLGGGRRLGEISRAWIMGTGLNTFCSAKGRGAGEMEGWKFLYLWTQAIIAIRALSYGKARYYAATFRRPD